MKIPNRLIKILSLANIIIFLSTNIALSVPVYAGRAALAPKSGFEKKQETAAFKKLDNMIRKSIKDEVWFKSDPKKSDRTKNIIREIEKLLNEHYNITFAINDDASNIDFSATGWANRIMPIIITLKDGKKYILKSFSPLHANENKLDEIRFILSSQKKMKEQGFPVPGIRKTSAETKDILDYAFKLDGYYWVLEEFLEKGEYQESFKTDFNKVLSLVKMAARIQNKIDITSITKPEGKESKEIAERVAVEKFDKYLNKLKEKTFSTFSEGNQSALEDSLDGRQKIFDEHEEFLLKQFDIVKSGYPYGKKVESFIHGDLDSNMIYVGDTITGIYDFGSARKDYKFREFRNGIMELLFENPDGQYKNLSSLLVAYLVELDEDKMVSEEELIFLVKIALKGYFLDLIFNYCLLNRFNYLGPEKAEKYIGSFGRYVELFDSDEKVTTFVKGVLREKDFRKSLKKQGTPQETEDKDAKVYMSEKEVSEFVSSMEDKIRQLAIKEGDLTWQLYTTILKKELPPDEREAYFDLLKEQKRNIQKYLDEGNVYLATLTEEQRKDLKDPEKHEKCFVKLPDEGKKFLRNMGIAGVYDALLNKEQKEIIRDPAKREALIDAMTEQEKAILGEDKVFLIDFSKEKELLKAGIEECQQETLEIVSDEKLFEDVLGFKRMDIKDPLLVRRINSLYFLLLGGQVSNSKEVSELDIKLKEEFMAYPMIYEGKSVDDTIINEQILRFEPDRNKRKNAWMLMVERGKALFEKKLDLVRLQNKKTRELAEKYNLPYKNYFELVAATKELDYDEFMKLMGAVKDATDEETEKVIEEQKKILGVERLEPWDVLYASHETYEQVEKKYYPKEKAHERMVWTFKGLGLDTSGIEYDMNPREGKLSEKFPHPGVCFTIDPIDKDIRLLATPLDGSFAADAVNHEYGHGVHSYYTAQPGFFLNGYNIGIAEGMARFTETMIVDPDWLMQYARMPKDLIVEFLEARRKENLLKFRGVRHYIAIADFDRKIYEDPDQDLTKLYWDRCSDIIGLPSKDTVSDYYNWPRFAGLYHYIATTCYMPNDYANADFINAQNKTFLIREYGHILGNPAVGKWLIENYYRLGDSVEWQQMIEDATEEPINTKYYISEVLKPKDKLITEVNDAQRKYIDTIARVYKPFRNIKELSDKTSGLKDTNVVLVMVDSLLVDPEDYDKKEGKSLEKTTLDELIVILNQLVASGSNTKIAVINTGFLNDDADKILTSLKNKYKNNLLVETDPSKVEEKIGDQEIVKIGFKENADLLGKLDVTVKMPEKGMILSAFDFMYAAFSKDQNIEKHYSRRELERFAKEISCDFEATKRYTEDMMYFTREQFLIFA
ncbi:MAG: M3 family metallopeptidase [Candidatus Ancaeobacter aquaticus]|nr:M3 family metallopeptidase [Candidatus Ancaeobacter aquaticus]